jgi:uncharacterized membrane protein YdjX (TVP38/TMEM64 family)
MTDAEARPDEGRARGAVPPEAKAPQLRQRLIALAVMLAVIGVSIATLRRFLKPDVVLGHYDALQALAASHFGLAIALYCTVYVVVVSLSVPGAVLLTALGGLLFGWPAGGSAAVLSAGTGAVIVFSIARTAVGPLLVRDAGPFMARIATGLQDDVVSYMLFLRFTPVVPFFVVNVAAALFGVQLRTFALCTYFGIIPATFAFSAAGSALDGLVQAQKVSFDACRAAGGAHCSFDFSLKTLATPGLMAALAALGLVALLPAILKRTGLLRRPSREP